MPPPPPPPHPTHSLAPCYATVMDHSDSERKPAAATWATLSDYQKRLFYMRHPTIRITHTTFFVTPVVEHIIILFIYFIFYLCVLFMFVCCVSFLCVCVCGFFVWMVGFFLTGGGCVVPCSCTKDKNSIKKMLFVLFAIRVQNTGYIFLSLVHIVALGQKQTKTCISSPPVPKNRAALVFHFIFYFQISRQKTAPKHFRARAVTFAIV